MTDLQGCAIRDTHGGLGRIIEEAPLRVSWESELIPREESIPPTDIRLDENFEVLTLDNGWVPLGPLVRAPRQSTVRARIDEVHALLERSQYAPFKNSSHLGPGPRGRENDETKDWVCKCSKYNCICIKKKQPNKGRRKPIKIDPSYKSDYNSEFKLFVKNKKKKKKSKKKVAKKK